MSVQNGILTVRLRESAKQKEEVRDMIYKIEVSDGAYERYRLSDVASFKTLKDAVAYVALRCEEGGTSNNSSYRDIRILTISGGVIWEGRNDRPFTTTPSLDMLLRLAEVL